MLVLTRKVRDQIRIGDDITVTIVRVKGNTVRVGIEAPRSVRVVRGELAEFESAGGDETLEDGETIAGARGDDATGESADGARPSSEPAAKRRSAAVKPSVALAGSW